MGLARWGETAQNTDITEEVADHSKTGGKGVSTPSREVCKKSLGL